MDLNCYMMKLKLEIIRTVSNFSRREKQSNIMSVIPCHLNDDLHEWFNEIVTVPN